MLLQNAKESLAEEALSGILSLPNVHNAPTILNGAADVEERSRCQLAVWRDLKVKVVVLLLGAPVELQQLRHRHGSSPGLRTATQSKAGSMRGPDTTTH